MKKFLAIAVVAVSLVACNDSTESTKETSDTQTVVTQPAPDTTQVITTTETNVSVDSNKIEGNDTTNRR